MIVDRTIDLIHVALDASLMRQTAITYNIANANTKEYQAIGVSFEQQLYGDTEGMMKPIYTQKENHGGIDEQIALSVKNATHYRALIKGLNHKLSIMKLALQGNNQS
jgi:flagellar basal-body rod protein FlgB